MQTNSATPTTTLRATARQLVIDSVTEAAHYEHSGNYHKLHVHRDGDVRWTEYLNRSDDTIDSGADGFAAIPSVAVVGTGSYACNCDYCDAVYSADDEALAREQGREYDKSTKFDTAAEAIADAVGDADLSDLEAKMLAAFDVIPCGYFDDEDEYVIETMYHPTEFTDQWVTDQIGDNPPRTREQCETDVAAFRAGECGPEYAASFAAELEGVAWRIREVAHA